MGLDAARHGLKGEVRLRTVEKELADLRQRIERLETLYGLG
jgi:hypothetical protein